MDQLTLKLTLNDDATFENYYGGENVHLVTALQDLVAGDGAQFIYLWGDKGSGRTHLLQACCHAASEGGVRCTYIPLRAAPTLSPAVLQELAQLDVICLDDIDSIATNQRWEEALFHLYNSVKANGVRLVVTANAQPSATGISLPDLSSRLAWGVTFRVHQLSDDEKRLALAMRAQQRGLTLPDDVSTFLLRRLPRNMTTLFNALAILDEASLSAQRRLTIPFVKSILRKVQGISHLV